MRCFRIDDSVADRVRVRRVACLARRGEFDGGVLMVLRGPGQDHLADGPGFLQTLPPAGDQLTYEAGVVVLIHR